MDLKAFCSGRIRWRGAINVRSAAPKVGEGLSGRVAASFESDNGEYFEGHISGSLTDTVAMRLSVMDRTIDGYLKKRPPRNAAYSAQPSTDETIARIGFPVGAPPRRPLWVCGYRPTATIKELALTLRVTTFFPHFG